MNDSQNLGTVSTWQIKNFPDGLRHAIVERAGAEKITVGELLTRITVAVIESDWQAGEAVNPSGARSTANELTVVERAISAAVALAGAPDVPITFRRRANRLLRESLPPVAPHVASGKVKLLAAPLRAKMNGAGAERTDADG